MLFRSGGALVLAVVVSGGSTDPAAADPGGPVHPTWEDPTARLLSEGIGGPHGVHAGAHRWWTPVRVLLLLTAVCLALGMVQKAPCEADDWSGANTRYTHMCYSDLPYLYTGRGFAERAWPYSDDEQTRARYPEIMEYPVLISYWAYGTAWAAQEISGHYDPDARRLMGTGALFGYQPVQREISIFVVVNMLGFALLALLAVWLLARVDRRRPWDAVFVAASPMLALTALVNWDLLAVAAVAAALFAWSRERPVLTGVMIAIGTAAKLYPLFLLGGLLVLCVRRRRLDLFGVAALSALVAWGLLQLPAVMHPDGIDTTAWRYFWSFNSDRGADLGSLWLVVNQAGGNAAGSHAINLVSWAFFSLWCLGVLAIGLLAKRTPTLAQLGYLVLVGFLIVNKVYSPQYVLWLLPLAALARPRWRDQLVWQAGELFYFCSVWWYLGGELAPAGGGDAPVYWVAIVVRVLAELYLAAFVVRDLFRPERGIGATASPPPTLEDAQASTTWSKSVVV